MSDYCVTGGNGLIASHLVKALLEKGCRVRATVRDPENLEKVGFLWEMKGAKERLRLFKADLLLDGSFDEAIDGVDGVFHVACPIIAPSGDGDIQTMMVDPCVKGTLNVLNLCSKASTVKRIVLTSSVYAIQVRDDIQKISPLSESHWSTARVEVCGMHMCIAKTLAEKTACQVAEEKGLNLVVVNPSFVVGPVLSPHPSSTLKFVYDLIKGKMGGYYDCYVPFIHTDDTVHAHVIAMEESGASGRLICSSCVAHWSDIIPMLRAKYPEYPFESKLIKCKSVELFQDSFELDSSKIMKLGFPGFKSLPQMFDDCIKSFQGKGLL